MERHYYHYRHRFFFLSFYWCCKCAVSSVQLHVVLLVQVTGRQFLASEAWSTSEELLQELAITEVANGVLGVAIQSSAVPGFEHFLRSLNPVHRPDDEFLRDLWEIKFKCSPVLQILHSCLYMFLF